MPSLDMKRAVIDLLTGSFATTGYYGLTDVYNNTLQSSGVGLADDIFSQKEATERAEDLAHWLKYPISVTGEYVRFEYTVPKICVLRVSDRERPEYLGDFRSQDSDASNSVFETCTFGSEFDESVVLIVQAGGAGSKANRDDIYLALRELIIRGRGYFEGLGAQALMWQNGRDGEGYQPDKSIHIVHEARATLSFVNSLTWRSRGERITEVKGILNEYPGGAVEIDPYKIEP